VDLYFYSPQVWILLAFGELASGHPHPWFVTGKCERRWCNTWPFPAWRCLWEAPQCSWVRPPWFSQSTGSCNNKVAFITAWYVAQVSE
jgi:hypothetical protein